MSKKEKYKRYGYEDAYDTEKENNWTNRLNLDDCIEIMNNQYNEIEKLKQQLEEKDKGIDDLKQEREFMLEEVKNRGTCGLCEKLENKEINELRKQLEEKDKRIAELEDKDWYEGCIKQLEEQNEKLIKERDEKDKEIERLTSPCKYFINYNNHIVRKLSLGEEEVLLTPKEICDLLNGYAQEFMDSRERYEEWKRHKSSQYNSKKNYVRQVVEKDIRHQVCEEIREKAEYKNWSKAVPFVYVIKPEFLDQIEKGEI